MTFYCGWGVTRHVFLIGSWAIKIPRVNYGWKFFLEGLLANIQERAFGMAEWPELCPIIYSIPGGWLVVMRRARVMTDVEFKDFDMSEWSNHGDYIVPVEAKSDSFGWLNGKIVAIDYGS